MRAFPLFAIATVMAVPAAAQMAPKTTPKAFVMKAGASDQYEIQSSQLLLQTTQNAQLRDYANMMITDHTKSTADVKAAAQQAGFTPAPPKLDAMGTRNIAALRRTKGTARDLLYVQQQKTSHQMALELHQGYAANGTSEPLKTAAAGIAPVVQHHIEMISSM